MTVGYYPCDNPPTVGLQLVLPGTTNSRHVNGPVFNIEGDAFKLADNGNNNCTAIITGWGEGNSWTVGQPWFQGKYVDSQGLYGILTGVATLKDKTAAGAPASKNSATGGLRPFGSVGILGVVTVLSIFL